MDLEEICISRRIKISSAQDTIYWRALVNAALDLQVPQAMELVNYYILILALALPPRGRLNDICHLKLTCYQSRS